MFVAELHVGSFRHLKDAKFGPFRQPVSPSELIVLAGPNGGGKSTVLEILSLALTRRFGWQFWQPRSVNTDDFALKIGLSNIEVDELIAADRAKRSDPKVAAPFAEYLKRNMGYWVDPTNRNILEGDRPLNERAIVLASEKYSNFERKLGFFIRSERSFRGRGYNFSNISNRAHRLLSQHFNSISFGATEGQFSDIYDFIIEQSYDYTYKLGEYQKALMKGQAPTLPVDPIKPYNELLGKIFPGYSFADVTEANLSLRVKLPTGNEIAFDELSSGEKEVFFILAFFIRHNINNSIIIIDEPELHLHPELARKMLRTMRTIQTRNQIWCATHSAELIDEAGRERTYFLRVSDDRQTSECIPATTEKAELNVLRDMYGYSGYVGLSKKIVFSEGLESSADRKTFTNMFPGKANEIKIIPAGGHQELYRVNAAVLSLLESDFARCEFYLIRDHDYLSDEAVAKYTSHSPDRLFVLQRYHIENYLLEERLISSILSSVYQKARSEAEVVADLISIAKENSAAVARDMAVSRINELYQAEDCGIGRHSQNLNILRAGNEFDGKVVDDLKAVILAKAEEVNSQVSSRASQSQTQAIVEETFDKVRSALTSDMWKVVFPGRMLLQKFSKQHGLGDWPALQNLILEEMSKSTEFIPAELRDIFDRISP